MQFIVSLISFENKCLILSSFQTSDIEPNMNTNVEAIFFLYSLDSLVSYKQNLSADKGDLNVQC